jgi:DNA-binding CsgD family transcriptional regulator
MGKRMAGLRYGPHEYVVFSTPLSRPSCFAELTAAELAVAEWLMAGATTREIAEAREVSERTISNQLTHIYEKLGIESRHELVALVSRSRAPKG